MLVDCAAVKNLSNQSVVTIQN